MKKINSIEENYDLRNNLKYEHKKRKKAEKEVLFLKKS